MREQRRHQRVRFNIQPLMRIGQFGVGGSGELENISLGGLMLRTGLPLKVGEVFGCEFVVFDSPLIDMSAVVVSKIGVYGLLPVCKHFSLLAIGTTAHVYPASELSTIARAMMGYSRACS